MRLPKNVERLIGTRIVAVRPMTREEERDFNARPSNGGLVIVLENGWAIVPMADPEGNETGWVEIVETTPNPRNAG